MIIIITPDASFLNVNVCVCVCWGGGGGWVREMLAKKSATEAVSLRQKQQIVCVCETIAIIINGIKQQLTPLSC